MSEATTPSWVYVPGEKQHCEIKILVCVLIQTLGIQSPTRPENVAIGNGDDIAVTASARDGEGTQPLTGAMRSKWLLLFLIVSL